MFVPLKAFSCGKTARPVREVGNHGVGIDCSAEAHPGFISSAVEVDRHDEIHVGQIVIGWHPTRSAGGRLESARALAWVHQARTQKTNVNVGGVDAGARVNQNPDGTPSRVGEDNGAVSHILADLLDLGQTCCDV